MRSAEALRVARMDRSEDESGRLVRPYQSEAEGSRAS